MSDHDKELALLQRKEAATYLPHNAEVFSFHREKRLEGRLGCVFTYCPPLSEKACVRTKRNYLRGDSPAWVNQHCIAVSNSPGFYAEQEKARESAIEIKDGEEYLVAHTADALHPEVFLMTAKVVGDCSDMVRFSYSDEKPYLMVQADAESKAGTLTCSDAPSYY